ncbi:Endoglucanase [Trichinella pseudospiralis]
MTRTAHFKSRLRSGSFDPGAMLSVVPFNGIEKRTPLPAHHFSNHTTRPAMQTACGAPSWQTHDNLQLMEHLCTA